MNYGKDAEHIQGSPFSVLGSGESTSEIERFHGTLKARTKVMRGLKNIETAHEFTQGWLAHYNFLRPHEALSDKTPAEVAGVSYPYKNWQDIIRKHEPSKPVVIAIIRRIDALAEEPKKQGKPLRGWLAGFMSTRAAGQRYHVVYRVDNERKRVLVYMVGIRREGSRRDVYALAEHFVQRGLI